MAAPKVNSIVISEGLASDQVALIHSIAHKDSWKVITVSSDTEISTLPLAEIAAVFISTDVLGESSKYQLTPLMSLFCEIAVNSPNLKWLQASSAGIDRPQYQLLLDRGVTVTHAGGVAAKTVAHAATAGILALARDFPRFMAHQQNRRWVPARGADAPLDLPGQTALIVGLGAIGREIARLCQALDLEVIALNRSGNTPKEMAVDTRPISELDDILPEADWLILCCPLTDDTRGLIGPDQLQRLKPLCTFN